METVTGCQQHTHASTTCSFPRTQAKRCSRTDCPKRLSMQRDLGCCSSKLSRYCCTSLDWIPWACVCCPCMKEKGEEFGMSSCSYFQFPKGCALSSFPVIHAISFYLLKALNICAPVRLTTDQSYKAWASWSPGICFAHAALVLQYCLAYACNHCHCSCPLYAQTFYIKFIFNFSLALLGLFRSYRQLFKKAKLADLSMGLSSACYHWQVLSSAHRIVVMNRL